MKVVTVWFILAFKHFNPTYLIQVRSFVCVCRPFFKASIFAKLLGNDPYGRISVMQFFNYVMRKVWLHQTRIGLSLYDVAGLGYLRESVCFLDFLQSPLNKQCKQVCTFLIFSGTSSVSEFGMLSHSITCSPNITSKFGSDLLTQQCIAFMTVVVWSSIRHLLAYAVPRF